MIQILCSIATGRKIVTVGRAGPIARFRRELSRSLWRRLALLSLVSVSPAGLAAGTGLEPMAEPLPAKPLVLEQLDGEQFDLSEAEGRVVLVNFWAVWCTPCRAEMPSMEKLNQHFADNDFEIVAVDMGSSRKHIDAFLEDMDPALSFTIVLDESGATASDWGVRGIPVSYVVDRQGRLVYRAVGERDWLSPSIVSTLQSLLDQP